MSSRKRPTRRQQPTEPPPPPPAQPWDDEGFRRFVTADIVRPVLLAPRRCFWVPYIAESPHGFIPSLVAENDPGHWPMTGDPEKEQRPWYWGQTFEDAKRICTLVNREVFGVEPEQANRIVMSSMAAQNRADAAREAGDARYDAALRGQL